jgi:hypothetical protein
MKAKMKKYTDGGKKKSGVNVAKSSQGYKDFVSNPNPYKNFPTTGGSKSAAPSKSTTKGSTAKKPTAKAGSKSPISKQTTYDLVGGGYKKKTSLKDGTYIETVKTPGRHKTSVTNPKTKSKTINQAYVDILSGNRVSTSQHNKKDGAIYVKATTKDKDGNFISREKYGVNTDKTRYYKKQTSLTKDKSNKTPESKPATSKAPAKSESTPTPKVTQKATPAKGKTVAELWKEKTGTSWAEAKKQGLTDGSMEKNLKVLKDLKAGKYDKKESVDRLPTKKVTSVDNPVTDKEKEIVYRNGGKKRSVKKVPMYKRGGKKK